MKNARKKSATGTSRSALAEVITGFLVSILLLGTAGWWTLENCRKADRLVKEYGTMLAEAEKRGTVEDFLKLR